MANRFKVIFSFGDTLCQKEFSSILYIENWFNGSFLYPTQLTQFRIYDLNSGNLLCSLSSSHLFYNVYFTKKHGFLKIRKNKNFVKF